jgi:UDP-N-acetylmuramate dehydrogenase
MRRISKNLPLNVKNIQVGLIFLARLSVSLFPLMKHYPNYSLLPHNTFGMDVRAELFFEYDTVDELRSFLQTDDFLHRERFIHIGSGSNLLFKGDYDGIVIHSAIQTLEVTEDTTDHVLVRVGSGYVWDDFVAYCVEHGWAGVENLSAIPGEVGASAVQNIGAYGVEVKDVIVCVETMRLDGTTQMFTNEECHYGYRDSIFKRELRGKHIVTHVTYRLEKEPTYRLDYGDLHARVEAQGEPTLKTVRNAVTTIRDSKLPDPKVMGNAGSFFTNPVIPLTQYETLKAEYPNMPSYPIDNEHVKVPAGWLIDHAGWKGKALGRAAVHDRQALVLVNLGGATGLEVMTLAGRIREEVYNKYGIHITPEVNYI